MYKMVALSCCLLLASLLAPVWAADPYTFSHQPRTDEDPALIAPLLAQPPRIDGELDDAVWQQAVRVDAFWRAGDLDLAEDQTIAWLGYDADNLYLAWACADRKIVSNRVAHDENGVWKQDAVEVFLSPERDGATERQFILSVSGARFDRRPGAQFGEHGKGWNPTWEGQVKPQSFGYTAEMRIPLAEVTDLKQFPVRPGTQWTLKLTRHDRGDYPGTRTSSWTRIGMNTADRHALGKLFFSSRNLLTQGSAETVGADGAPTGWSFTASHMHLELSSATDEKTDGQRSAKVVVSGKKIPGAMGRVTLAADTLPAQPVETTYRFSADVKAVSPDGTLVAYLVAFQANEVAQLNFKHNADWQHVETILTVEPGQKLKVPLLQTGPVSGMSKKDEGGGAIYLDNIRLEIIDAVDLGLDPDSVCLTGNATDAYRTRNGRIAGTYTYYQPNTTDPWFPHYFLPGTGPEQDYGLYRGQVPFDRGRLTDGHLATTVNWPTFWEGHRGHDFVFDLQQEYEVTRVVVKTSWPGQRLTSVYCKSPDERIYTLVASEPDHVTFKTGGKHGEELPRTDTKVFSHLNQRARYVRVQAEARGPAQFAEIEIWGKPLQPGATLPRKAYQQLGGATPIKNPVGAAEPVRETPPLYPVPQQLTLAGAAVALPEGLTIHYEPTASERARITAEVLRDELQWCFGVTASIAPAAAGAQPTVLIGEAADSPLTTAALQRLKQSITAQDPGPEGYVLATGEKQVIIAGSDPRGAFYGVQALLTLARRDDAGALEVPGALVRDWPAMPIRIIEGRGVPAQGLVRALARFRVNYYTPKFINIHQAAEFDAFAERYFVSFIPFLDFNSTVLHTDQTLTERPATERLEDVPMDSRRNANPGHPRTWEIYFAALDKWLPQFHGDILYIGMDETYQYESGSRWNVSPESRALGMSAGPLLAYTINKIDQKAKQYGKRVMMHDTPFFRDFTLSYSGDPDPSWRKAIPLLPKDLLFNVWHWNKKWVLDPLGKEYGFDLVYLCTGDRDWRVPAHVDPNEDVPPFEFPGYFKGMNNYMAESSFTASKLLETVGVAWNPAAVRPKDPQANAAVARYVMLWNELHLGEIQPPSLRAEPRDFTAVNLRPAANRSRLDEVASDGEGWVDLGPNVDLRALPAGKQVMAGVPFDIIDEASNAGKGLVMAHNAMYVDRTLPPSVTIDTGNLQAASLVFLHCLDHAPGWNYLRRQELAGFYFMVYADGTYSKFELKYGTSIGTYDGQRYLWEYAPAGDAMTYGKPAWIGQSMSGMPLHLYSSEWVNPKPNVPITQIILRTAYDPSPMNPMLLAVTAVNKRLAEVRQDVTLPAASLLTPTPPVGVPLDLAGGVDEAEDRYVAPNGVVLTCSKINNGLSERTANAFLANDYRSYVGMVTVDGAQSVRAEELYVTLPQPTSLTGVQVTNRFREQRKAANFPAFVYNLYLDVSADQGKTWRQVAQALAVSSEEHGPTWMPLPDAPVSLLRVRQERCAGTPDYAGFSRLVLYQQK